MLTPDELSNVGLFIWHVCSKRSHDVAMLFDTHRLLLHHEHDASLVHSLQLLYIPQQFPDTQFVGVPLTHPKLEQYEHPFNVQLPQ
jgi:hypothetical protein